jgi:hypothetical protein
MGIEQQTCNITSCNHSANYWWHSAVGNKKIGMCFGHATNKQKTGGWRERKWTEKLSYSFFADSSKSG